MKRLIATLPLLIIVLLPGIARADQPLREFLPAEDTVIEGICSFDVALNIVANNEFTMSFSDDEGNLERQIVTGQLVVELVNLSNPDNSVVVNISGPGIFTFEDETTTLQTGGLWLLWFFPGDLGPDDPGLIVLTSGLWMVEFTPDGTSIVSRSGATQDVCALLS
jgi:hypothetical protein